MTQNPLPVLIFLTPFFFTLVVPLAGRISQRLAHLTASGALVLATILSARGLLFVSQGASIDYAFAGWGPPIGIEWYYDGLSAVMSLLVCAVAALITLVTREQVQKEVSRKAVPYYMCVLLVVSGLLGIIFTRDLFNLFVFLEVSSLAAYALIAAGDPRRGSYASLKYLFIGSMGASLYLLGVGYLYANTGTLNMADMSVQLAAAPGHTSITLGVLLIFLGLIIKMGLFPFHGWLPDAYTWSSNPVTCFIAPLMTKVAIYAFVRIFFYVLAPAKIDEFDFMLLLRWMGIAAIVIGAVMAFRQDNLKRMLAYSSVGHLGLIALAVGADNRTALSGAFLHIINHAVMKASLFLCLTSMFTAHGIQTIKDVAKLRGVMPWTSGFFLIAALSMVGIPPFAGFFSKWYIVVGVIEAGMPFAALVIVGSSLLTALYIFRMIENLFYAKNEGAGTIREAVPLPMIGSAVLTACVVLLGLAGPSIFTWLRLTALSGGPF